MATVNLDLPAELVSAAGLDKANVSMEAARLIALELFREGVVSLGRAAELCATPLAAFMDFAASRGVPPLNYGIDQLKERRVAHEHGLGVIGCVGVLQDAFSLQFESDLPGAYRTLLSSGAYVHRAILEHSLRVLNLPPL